MINILQRAAPVTPILDEALKFKAMNFGTPPATSQRTFHETFLNTYHHIMNKKGNPTVSSTLCQPSSLGVPGERPAQWSLQLGHLVMWPSFLAGPLPLPSQTNWHCPYSTSSSATRNECPGCKQRSPGWPCNTHIVFVKRQDGDRDHWIQNQETGIWTRAQPFNKLHNLSKSIFTFIKWKL